MQIKSPKTIFRLFFLILLFTLLLTSITRAQPDKTLFSEGTQAARTKKIELAFMAFRKIVTHFPESKYAQDALFSIGEYYFSIQAYNDAQKTFTQFNSDFPESKARPFALAYLIKIAERENAKEIINKLKKEIIGLQQVSLVFRDFKELNYLSALNNNYKIINFIDKIEIFINDTLFEEIHF